MNKNIDLTKILNGCPKGTKFYSPLFGEVEFVEMDEGHIYPIITKIQTQAQKLKFFSKEGYYFNYEGVECLLFPSKDQRDWSKFERFWDKPKVEKFDPKTFQPFDKVLVRLDNGNEDEWHIDLFESFDEEVKVVVPLVHLVNNHVIPYNDETKHLVGISDDCPDYYKWWEV